MPHSSFRTMGLKSGIGWVGFRELANEECELTGVGLSDLVG